MLRGWIKNLESQGSFSLPLLGDSNSTKVTVAKELEFMREGSKKSVMVKYVGNTNSSPLWDKIRSSYINSQAKLRSLALKFQWQCEQFLYKTCNIWNLIYSNFIFLGYKKIEIFQRRLVKMIVEIRWYPFLHFSGPPIYYWNLQNSRAVSFVGAV